MNDEALKLQNQLCFPLYASARKTVGLYTPYLKPLGLTYTQYIVFLVLWEKDGISVNKICERLMLDSGTITPLLKKLEKSGYIERVRSKQDERSVVVNLSEKGKKLKEQVKDIPLKIGSCINLSEDEAKMLYSILYKLMEN